MKVVLETIDPILQKKAFSYTIRIEFRSSSLYQRRIWCKNLKNCGEIFGLTETKLQSVFFLLFTEKSRWKTKKTKNTNSQTFSTDKTAFARLRSNALCFQSNCLIHVNSKEIGVQQLPVKNSRYVFLFFKSITSAENNFFVMNNTHSS